MTIGALVLVGLLFILPRYVVKSDKKNVTDKTTSKTKTTENDSIHGLTFSPEDKKQLDVLVKNTNLQSEKTVKSWADSVILLYQKANFYDSAAAFADNILQKFETSLPLRESVGDANYQAAIFSTQKEKSETLMKKSRLLFEEILEKDPNNLDVKTKYGLTFLSSEPMKGIKIIRDEVLTQNPDHLFAIRSMGLMSMQTGQFDKAAARFDRYLTLKADDAEVQLYWSISQMELGRKDEAMKGFDKVLTMTNDPALVQSAKQYQADLAK